MGASSHIVYQSEVLGRVTITEKYYYEIKKKEDGKYLIIEYSDFKSIYGDTYLEIEHTKVNGITATIILVFSSIGLNFIFLTKIFLSLKLFIRINNFER